MPVSHKSILFTWEGAATSSRTSNVIVCTQALIAAILKFKCLFQILCTVSEEAVGCLRDNLLCFNTDVYDRQGELPYKGYLFMFPNFRGILDH